MATKANIEKINRLQEAFFKTANRAGCPRDQVASFAARGYIAQPKQLEFHAAARACDAPGGPTQVGFGGARGPGKSHAVFAQIALDDCQRYPGLKVLYLRKIAKNAKEQFEDLRRSVLRFTAHDYSAYKGTIDFPNESRIFTGHFKNESDVDNYLGLEYDIICIEEATTLTETKYKTLRDSNRTSKENFRPRIYASTNPGSVGHGWFKKRFIDPARAGNESDTRFVFATVDDNKFIDAGYKKKLEENTGWKLRAYRYGDWDVFAGQFFTNFRYERHVFAPEQMPGKDFIKHGEVWASLDYGYKHWMASHLFFRYDGEVYVLDEFGMRQALIESYASGFKEWLAGWGLSVTDLLGIPAGTDVFAKKGDSGASYAEKFAENGIILQAANTSREHGAGLILQMLGDEQAGIEPSIKISSKCKKLIETLPLLEHNPNKPNDVLKIDADEEGAGGDDFYDDFRYGIATDLSLGVYL